MSKIVWSLLLLSCVSAQGKPKLFSAYQLVSKVINDLPHDNVLLSPPAINLALAQLYLAAGGETEAELRNVLGYTDSKKAEVLTYFQRLQALTTAENPRFRIASRLYNKGIKLTPSYQKIAKTHSNIEPENMDVTAKGVAKINQWIASNTDPSLEELIDPLLFDESMKAFMVTAISFSGRWQAKFNPIADGLFYIADEDRSVSVKMMQVVGTFRYEFDEALEGHVVIIPYANSTMSMVLMIPRSSSGIKKIEENLLHLNSVKLVPKPVRLTLPQFSFRYKVDLIQALIDLGVNKNVFAQANLSEAVTSKGKVRIDSILQSSFFQVDNEGSKSAIATGKNHFARTVAGPKELDIVVNRPFMFSINEGKKVLFIGRFSHPV